VLRQLRLVIITASSLLLLNISGEPEPPATPRDFGLEANFQDGVDYREHLIQEAIVLAFGIEAGVDESQARQVVGLVERELVKYRNLDLTLVLGLILTESQANYQAISPKGARGVMQIMPATGRFIAANFREDWQGSGSLHDVERNIRYGIWYLDYLGESFPQNQRAVVAAYYWGPPSIKRRLRRGQGLPEDYPSKVWAAKDRIERKMYDHYETLYREHPGFD
jgi:soluble lytic murein transglycosylase-like protein